MANKKGIQHYTIKNNKSKKNSSFNNNSKDKNYIYFSIISLVILTLIVFSNCLDNYFITNLDDNLYISAVESLYKLTSADFKTIFTGYVAGIYHPLTVLSLAIGFHYHALDAYSFHLVNLIFHTANVVLVFWFIYTLLKRVDAAFIVALFFAIHPMHVESVAWIAERKDVLYSFFFIGSLISYLYFIKDDSKYKYLIISIVLFILSLLSKSAAVSLAPVIVLLDYYSNRKFTTKVILEKIPFFLLSLAFGILSIISQGEGSALNNLNPVFTIFDKFFLISYGVMFYITKVFYAFNLSAFHYYPEKVNGMLPIIYYLAPLGVALIIFLLFKLKKIRKDLIFGLLFFFFTIVLVLQFIPVGFAIVAERYSYVPYIGLFFIVAKLYCDFTDNKFGNYNANRKSYIMATIVIIALIFSYSTYQRNKTWETGIVLFTDIIEKNPTNGHAYWARGNGKYDMKDFNGALADFNNAIINNYRYPVIYSNKANCYYMMDSAKQAIKYYSEAIKVDSTYGMAYYNMAIVKQGLKDFNGAINDYKKAVKCDFNVAWSYNGIGYSLLNIDSLKDALVYFDKAIKKSPDYASAYHNKGIVEYNLKDYNSAINDYNKAIELDPKYALSYYNRGLTKIVIKDNNACADFSKAAELGYKPANDALKQYCNSGNNVKF